MDRRLGEPTSRARMPAQLDPTKLGVILRATPKRTAADIYGWTYEHLQISIGEEEATEAMGRFLNHVLGGRILQGTLEGMSLVKVTPLLKGPTGKVRPITVGTTLTRISLSATLTAKTNLKDIVGDTEFAIGRISATEDLGRGIGAAIEKVKAERGKANVFQLGCSCAFNRTSRQAALRNLEERLPHLLTPIGQWLRLPMTHILRTDEGEPIEIVTMDGLPQGCPSAPLAFSLAMGDPEHEFFQAVASERINPNHFALRRYMDDMTLVTAPHVAERCYAELKEALARSGVKLSEDKRTAWATDGKPPAAQEARALWESARDHRGFVVCGLLATCEDPASEAALAVPIGDPNYVEASLETRKKATEELTRRIAHLATMASASTPTVYPCVVSSAAASHRKWGIS